MLTTTELIDQHQFLVEIPCSLLTMTECSLTRFLKLNINALLIYPIILQLLFRWPITGLWVRPKSPPMFATVCPLAHLSTGEDTAENIRVERNVSQVFNFILTL